MKVADFIAASLTESQDYAGQAVNGLTAEELSFRVKPFCNSIVFLLWHLARMEDFWTNRILSGGKEIYETEGWYQKLGTPAGENGLGYDVDKLDKWPAPALELLQSYAAAVRQKTLDYLDKVDEKKLDEARDFPWRKGTVGLALSHLVTEVAEHTGQIGYIKGIMRGIEPSPPPKQPKL